MSILGNPVNGLPSELICLIFWLTIDPEGARKDRCRLMLVCRQWRECVEGSALLWTDISASHGSSHVCQALEKSRGAMIDIECQLSMRPTMDLGAFMAEVGPHIARWRSLMVAMPQSIPTLEGALAPLTTAQAPNLEILKLTVQYRSLQSGNPITLFGGAPAPPTLKQLTVRRISISVKPLRLSGLVSLDLSTVPEISTTQLLEMLRGSPGLETLRLEDNPGMVAIESQPSGTQPIELVKLVSLSLEWIDNGAANSILSHIRIPNRRCVSIRTLVLGVSARSVLFTTSIAHLLHKTIPASDITSSVIRVKEKGPLDYMINFRDVKLKLYVGEEDHIQEILGWLVESLGVEAAECPVHFILDWPGTNQLRLAEVPPPLTVKHLRISDSVNGSSIEAFYLAIARAPNPTSFGWLLPQMESLSVGVKTLESQKQLVSMLRSRYEGATSTGETTPRCPVNLRSVELRGKPRTRGLVEEIKGILGEANVFWSDE